MTEWSSFPGHELVLKGMADLQSGSETAEALFVAIRAHRLRRAGLKIPDVLPENPEHRLYAMLATTDSDSAHSRYNALIRQLVSFERAAEATFRRAVQDAITLFAGSNKAE